MNGEDVIFRQKFESIFREYFTGLTNFARKYTGDLDSAKEIVHSVFIRIWEKRQEFEWDKPAKSYLFTSVYNRSLNNIRDNRKFSGFSSDGTPLNNEIVVYNDALETAELEERIDIALKKLPEKCREVFKLSRFSEKKYSEIAQILGISVKTVETHMSKALHLLKDELKDYLYLIILFILKNLNSW